MSIPSAVSAREVGGFAELLEAQAAAQPDAVAFTYLEQGEEPAGALTYGQLDRLARRLAAELQARAAPGSRVLLVFPNRLEFVVAFMGCLYAGMVAVPAAPPWHERAAQSVARIAAQADVALVLAHRGLQHGMRRRLAQALDERPMLWPALDQLHADAESAWRRPRTGRDSLAFLQYTSGSTGSTKGVMVSHGNLLHNCQLLRHAFAFEEPFRLVSWLPFFHDWGLIGCVLFPLSQGAQSWFFDPASFLAKPQRWLRAIQRWRANLSCAPNFAYDLCVRRIGTDDAHAGLDLSAWEVAMVGAEPVRGETLRRFHAAFSAYGFRSNAFYPSYGLAENTLIVSGGRRGAEPVRHGQGSGTSVGCGYPLPGQDVRIVDPESGAAVAPRRMGEVWVGGASVALGYWALPEETRATFKTDDSGKGRWLRTGDLGFLSDGQLFICGRVKDVIIKAGRNLFAADIENAAESGHAALRPGCGAAFAVDAAGAERMVVAHELDFGQRSAGQDVVAAIQRRIVAQFAVKADAIVLIKPGTLQKTSSGKIRRLAMREAFLAGQLDVIHAWRNW